MNSYNHIQDRRERIVKKATRILAGVTYHQPFYEANKQTALAITRLFLRRNGFNLSVGTKQKKEELYDVLTNTIRDVSIFEDVEQYLLRRVTLLY